MSEFFFRAMLPVMILLLQVCPAGRATAAETRINGRVSSGTGGPLQGVVAIETGRLYSKSYRYGGRIDEQGRFSVRVPRGGDYAVHIYATGYVYHPIGLKIEDGRTNRFSFTVPPNPAIAEAPVISRVLFETRDGDPGQRRIRLEVNDPNGNLSHQVLGINTATEEAFIFEPSGFVFPWARNYPNGTYTLSYDTGGRPFKPAEWLFVAADNRCYSSAVLRSPFNLEEGVVPAQVEGAARPEAVPQLAQERKPTVAFGRRVFADNCAVCHYPDKTATKVGPGLKGLFRRELTPVEKIPVTEGNIRRRIENGGENMPPYAHIRESARSALLLYLKTL
ncbi:hypothetical protein C2E25_00890 [Geothermobacter hydrogeniphilus]|uniref:Cytochrome c domain-containing protein n=1 Tax=Geothermobacter hydrogeniphilus TaxID=1969733 RepID=A0A2K2HEV0_9BACT|nr:c-type cytochrome [Geothermobacter hydrogeniphilus]PNU21817.1 hypothetical protein C2E25_00890 [Geothermobacter hydrogeniphilus]